jgi:uncharacterized protein
MPEYLAPGVYVEEIDTGSKPIEGVSTSTSGMVGVTERGPINVPILITSFGEFRRWFGDHLDATEFRNANGFHCYMPHGVEGFFTNGGQRVYVTRVVRDDAVAANMDLFDRGGAASVESMLLRTAGQSSGTLVNMPLVSVLAPGTLAANDWIRIGDGSQSEYRQVVSVNPTTHVPLNYPLSFSHDAGSPLRQFTRLANPAYAGTFTFSADAPAGSTTVTIAGANADLTVMDGALATTLLEIGTHPHTEHRFITAISGTGGTRTITFDSPLAVSHASGSGLAPMQLSAAPVNNTTLRTAATAGDSIVFGAALGANFTNVNTLVVVDLGTPEQEVRRIGALNQLALEEGAYAIYPRGTRVEQFASVDDDRRIQAVLAGADTAILQAPFNTIGLSPGQAVVLDPGGVPENAVIMSVDETANSVRFTAGLAAHAAGTIVQLAAKSLTADAAVGDVALSLDNRLGLGVNDVIRIGVSPNEEYVTIAAISGAPGAPPDAGGVVLANPLARAHASGTQIRRQATSAATGAHHPAFTVVDTPAGSTALFVGDDDGFTAGDLVRVRTPLGINFFHTLSGAAAAVAPLELELDRPLDRSHEVGSPVAGRESLIEVEALDPGSWGNRLRIAVEDEPAGMVSGSTLAAVNNPSEIRLSSPTGVESGTILELMGPNPGDAAVGPLVKVASINRTNNRIALATPLNGAQMAAHIAAQGAGLSLRIRSREFRLSVFLVRRPDPAFPTRDESIIASEVFPHLSMDPRHSRYVVTAVGALNAPLRLSDRRPEGPSWYIRVSDVATTAADLESIRLGPETLVDILPSGRRRAARHPLMLGDDSLTLLADTDYIGTDAVDPEDRTGIQSLKNIEEVSIVAVPGRTSAELQGALISHCEEMRYRFAVLDGPRPPNDAIADVMAQRQMFDTKYAALYHPWMLVPEPYPTTPTASLNYQIPPAGHIVGVYARTDIQRGVHKAPANEVVNGIIGLQRVLNKGEQDILNPYPVNINVIRDFRPNNRGIRVWGGRVITSDSDWKYVNVRRLLIFIEHSIDRGLQWVVFEPNAEPLWARVRRSITNFLTTVWRNGALEGTKVEEAFFVRCDRTTMTQDDIDNGRLICVIGVAPVKPAEFVIIRIGLWTASADQQ